MTAKRYNELKALEKMMTTIPGFDPELRETPKCCEECEYYQPSWKYRNCRHVRCPYQVKKNTFREQPLENDLFPSKEVVRMDGI